MDFLVATDDLHRCRFEESPAKELETGQVRLAIRSFGLSANNITYAMFGEAMAYWSFFPAPAGWGRVPVWGFAEVAESRCEQLEEGVRVYGYLPPSSELVVEAARVDQRGFVDASAHRRVLPPAYNGYARTDADPIYEEHTEDQQMLLRPLFFTSYLIDDFLAERAFFDADSVIVSSASSKTSNALAFLLAQHAEVEVVGLTSPRGVDFTRGLGVYGQVIAYDSLDSLPAGRAVYVDVAGDAAVREAVHRHYGEQLTHSAVVGATHHGSMGAIPDDLPGPRPMLFFAPDRVTARTADWGREGFEHRLAQAWRPYVDWTRGWLQVEHASGPEQLESAYLALLDGNIDPARAHVLSLT